MKRITITILVIVFLSSFGYSQENYSIEVLDGVPYLVEYGVPQGGTFFKTDRKRINLDGEWLFRIDPLDVGEAEAWHAEKVDEKAWSNHDVPSVWQMQDPNLRFYDGSAWYRKTFEVPADFEDSDVFLRFEGASLTVKVWLNGKLLGVHDGGYTPFRFDVTDILKPGKQNVLVVRCDNRISGRTVPPRSEPGVFAFLNRNISERNNPLLKGDADFSELGWWLYGGIHRSVYIEAVPKVNIVKSAITATPKKDGGEFKLEGIIWNRSPKSKIVKLTCEFDSALGVTIETLNCGEKNVPARGFASFRVGGTISGVAPWSPSNPNLYDLKLTAKTEEGADAVTIRFGFRTFEIKDGKFLLNGKEVFLFGINRQEDDPAVGLAQTQTVINNDLDLIQELGVNFIRPGYHPAHDYFLDECDKRGIMVIEEIPLYQASGWQLSDPEILARAKLQLIEMIERDINRPSVVMWSLGSEAYSLAKNAGSLARELKMTARRMDLIRPVTMPLLVVPHITNRRDFIAPEMDALFVNEFFGWAYGSPNDAVNYLESLHRNYPDKPIVVSEFGAHGMPGFRDPTMRRAMSEEWQANLIATHLILLAEKQFIKGFMPWAFSDFPSPRYVNKRHYPYINLGGVVDERRVPKVAFWVVKDFYNKLKKERYGG